MTQLIENKILTKIKKAKRGTLFFVDNFISFGSQKAVSKALQRLVAKGEIYRVAPGIFVRPEIYKFIRNILALFHCIEFKISNLPVKKMGF